MSAPDWMDDALCAQIGPADWMFFPPRGGSNRDGKRLCQGCPVRAACLEYSLDNGFDDGIYGGLSPRERRALAGPRTRAVRPINHGTEGGWKTHRRRGEQPCSECIQAVNEGKRRREARRAS